MKIRIAIIGILFVVTTLSCHDKKDDHKCEMDAHSKCDASCKMHGDAADHSKMMEEHHGGMHKKHSSVKSQTDNLKKKGYEVFSYFEDTTEDSIIMQQYFIAFLKKGPNRSQGKEEADSLQALHMAHLGRMYNEGYSSISGPFGDDGEIRGITIYNVPTLKMADSLANADPMVKAGRLVIEVHPWWAAKGFHLR